MRRYADMRKAYQPLLTNEIANQRMSNKCDTIALQRRIYHQGGIGEQQSRPVVRHFDPRNVKPGSPRLSLMFNQNGMPDYISKIAAAELGYVRGRCDRKPLVIQKFFTDSGIHWRSSKTNRHVGLALDQINTLRCRRYLQRYVGMAPLEVGQSRQKPEASKRRQHAQSNTLVTGYRGPYGVIKALQTFLNSPKELAPLKGKFDDPGMALKKRHPEQSLKFSNSMTDGAVGKPQLAGGTAEAAKPSDRFEGHEQLHRWKSAEFRRHSFFLIEV